MPFGDCHPFRQGFLEMALRVVVLVRGSGRGRAVASDRVGACVRVMCGRWRRSRARQMRGLYAACDGMRCIAHGGRAGNRDRSACAAT